MSFMIVLAQLFPALVAERVAKVDDMDLSSAVSSRTLLRGHAFFLHPKFVFSRVGSLYAMCFEMVEESRRRKDTTRVGNFGWVNAPAML
jgi:hypothetical protein